jgi:hypothetical protein
MRRWRILTGVAAQRLVEAHLQSEEAEGASRAISLAKHGQAWVPFDLQAEAEALFSRGRKTA